MMVFLDAEVLMAGLHGMASQCQKDLEIHGLISYDGLMHQLIH